MKYLPNSSKYKGKVLYTSMELIWYDGSTFPIKFAIILVLIKQMPFMPLLIFTPQDASRVIPEAMCWVNMKSYLLCEVVISKANETVTVI